LNKGQPFFTLIVAAVLFIVPVFLLNLSTDVLNNMVVQPVVERQANEISLKIKE
jgi:hypothetical protein